jgi:hypothetical protein
MHNKPSSSPYDVALPLMPSGETVAACCAQHKETLCVQSGVLADVTAVGKTDPYHCVTGTYRSSKRRYMATKNSVFLASCSKSVCYMSPYQLNTFIHNVIKLRREYLGRGHPPQLELHLSPVSTASPLQTGL